MKLNWVCALIVGNLLYCAQCKPTGADEIPLKALEELVTSTEKIAEIEKTTETEKTAETTSDSLVRDKRQHMVCCVFSQFFFVSVKF